MPFYSEIWWHLLPPMRAVLQRVSEAHVTIQEKIIGQISRGLLVLLGISAEDDESDIDWLIRKMTQLRIFEDEAGKMNLSLKEIDGALLVVSQFTLLADTKKGNRPSFQRAAKPEDAMRIYEKFLAQLGQAFTGPIATGQFGANMQVSLLNDGPVTILLDSKNPAW